MVVEYCYISKLIEREQYWIDILNPNNNVLKYVFSSQGYKHTPETPGATLPGFLPPGPKGPGLKVLN